MVARVLRHAYDITNNLIAESELTIDSDMHIWLDIRKQLDGRKLIMLTRGVRLPRLRRTKYNKTLKRIVAQKCKLQ